MPPPARCLLLLLLVATSAPSGQVENPANGMVAPLWGVNQTGCFLRPWVCRNRPILLQPILCCRNTCVDVRVDLDNCGFCGIRCPPNYGCCRGFCFNLLVNFFHCGVCFNRCAVGQACVFGQCAELGGGAVGGLNGTSAAAADGPVGHVV